MQKNKFTTYLLYAVGEIFLVVIGILIAVSINNWNANRKDNNQLKEILASIIRDLESDIEEIDLTLEKVLKDQAYDDSLQQILTGAEVAEEEVIRIIKNDFRPFIISFDGFKDYTYQTAISNGTLNNMDEEIKSQIYDLYLFQKNSMNAINMFASPYFGAMSDYIKYYPLQNPIQTFNQGMVYDRKWGEADFDDLTARFNLASTTKRNYNRILKGR